VIEYLKGRSGRKEYWASIAILLLVGIGLALLHVNGASGVTTFLWFIVWGRRLHDINRSAAWVLAPLIAMIAVAALGFVLGGQPLMDAVKYSETGHGQASQTGVMWLFGVFAVMLLVQAGFTIWLGARKGDAGENRFGPPPNDTLTT
jgi:uncharacterized membrane protein YhaH (DUF805 family)